MCNPTEDLMQIDLKDLIDRLALVCAKPVPTTSEEGRAHQAEIQPLREALEARVKDILVGETEQDHNLVAAFMIFCFDQAPGGDKILAHPRYLEFRQVLQERAL